MQAPHIVCLHGLSASAHFFDPLRAELSSRNIQQSFAFDLLGFGNHQYDGTDYTLTEHLDHIRTKIDTYIPREPVHLIGHSLGGLLALEWAALYPKRVQSIVLLNVPLGATTDAIRESIPTMRARWARMLLNHPRTSRVGCFIFCRLRLMRLISPFIPAWIPRAVFNDYTRHTWRSIYQTFIHIVLQRPGKPLAEHLLAEGIPILTITASDDNAICRVFPIGHHGAHQELVGTHLLPLQDPGGVANIIENFYRTENILSPSKITL